MGHPYWGRPEDMTMSRPAYKIDTSNPGKLASRCFFPKFKGINSLRVTILVILSSATFISKIFKSSSDSRHFIFNFLLHSTNTVPRVGPGHRLLPPSLQQPSPTILLTPLMPTTCSHTPSSFSTSPTIIAANTVTQLPTPGITCNCTTRVVRKVKNVLPYKDIY